MLILLGLPAWALTWWVPDPTSADALTAELARSWPDSGVEIAIGPHPIGVEGLYYDGSGLVRIAPSGTQRAETAPDWPTLVLLARTWESEPEARPPGWIPTLPNPDPEPIEPDPVTSDPVIPDPAPEALPRRAWTLSGGAGARYGWSATGKMYGPRVVGRANRGALVVEADLYVATSAWASTGNLDRTLSVLTGSTEPSEFSMPVDTAALGIFAGIDPTLGQARDRRATLMPFAVGGLEARNVVNRTVSVPEAGGDAQVGIESDSGRLTAGPVAQIGVALGAGRVGGRAGVTVGTGGAAAFVDILVRP